MSFKVTEVIDGDTFVVSPGWELNKTEGDRVRPANLNAPEIDKPGGKEAKQKLKKLIEGKTVELKNAVNISFGRVVCDVYLDGTDIKDLL